ncbi:MAG: hypothetical protein JWO08_4167 [Verrucomicrobiaceae bacterium]|nr:hypothetical protein [Verrucomicrobiaceae bacterium]
MKPLLLTLALASTLSFARAASEWASLLDGKSLAGWTSADGGKPGEGWNVEADGVLHLSGKGAGILLSEKEYSNFELEWEWKLAEAGNNGIKYWVTKIGGKEWLGIEYQMIDDNKHPDGLKGGSHNTGSIYDIFDSDKEKILKPIGEWNSSRIVAKNGVLEHYLNGKLCSKADTKSDEWKEHLAKSKFKSKVGFAPGHGKIMLTEHGDPAWFRNMRIKEL